MNKLTLNETIALAVKNHLPIELVPGATHTRTYRFHVLIVDETHPALLLAFGDEKHGFLFDSAWVTTADGGRLRIKEADLRTFLETPATPPMWQRALQAPEPKRVGGVVVLNPDLAEVRVGGVVTTHTATGYRLVPFGEVAPVEITTDEKPAVGTQSVVTGTYHYPATIAAAAPEGE